MEQSLFYQITGVIALAGFVALLVSYLRQPAIIAYILTGLAVGSLGYARLQQNGVLDALGQIGITLLLFMVGLELDLKRIRQMGKVALLAGLGQIFFTSFVGYLIFRVLGFAGVPALYLAVALTFSSTIIVVKLLGEKRDLQALYARLVVGFLIVQDFVALTLLLILGGAGGGAGGDIFRSLPAWQYVLTMVVKVLILVLSLAWVSKKVFPEFLDRLGKSDELLMIFSLAWALGLAAFMALPAVGFSLETGGLVAGLALANSQVHYEISARVKSLRDFFLIIFFILFGARMLVLGPASLLLAVFGLTLFVSVGKPLIMMLIMGILGYTPRTSFFASLATAQVSEFSFVLVALGNRLGHVSDELLGLVTLVGVLTIAFSTYTMLYARQIYDYLRPALNFFDFKKGQAEKGFGGAGLKNHVILAGANRLGARFLRELNGGKRQLVVVDFDPHIAKAHSGSGYEVFCGDVTDPYIQDQIYLENAKLVISTVPDLADNLALISAVRQRSQGGKRRPKLIFLAQNDLESKYLYEQGVDYVLSPHFIGGLHLAKILEDDARLSGLKSLRREHLEVLG